MAIEIKELHVKLHIGENQSIPTKEDGVKNDVNQSNDVINQELIIEATTKEVLRILKEQNER